MGRRKNLRRRLRGERGGERSPRTSIKVAIYKYWGHVAGFTLRRGEPCCPRDRLQGDCRVFVHRVILSPVDPKTTV